MKPYFLLLAIVFSCLILFSCSVSDSIEIGSKVDLIMKSGTVIEKIVNLQKLDSETPSIKAKLNLSALFLQLNLPAQAEKPLEKLEELSHRLPSDLKYIYLVNLAAFQLTEKMFGKAVETATQARQVNSADPAGAGFTLSKAFNLLGQKSRAESGFTELWKMRKDEFSFDDCLIFISLAVESQNWKQAHEISDRIDTAFGFQPELGFVRASILKAENNPAGALSAFMRDIDFKISAGALEPKAAIQFVERMYSDLTKKDIDSKSNAQVLRLVKAFTEFINGNYSLAFIGLKSCEISITDKFCQFLMLYSLLQAKTVEMKTLASYVGFEHFMRKNPRFYLGLWGGMQRGKGLYDLTSVGPVLEAIIVSDALPESKEQARKELGHLMGINEINARYLLIPRELEKLGWGIVGNGELRNLDAMAAVLTTGTNYCSDYSWSAIRALAQQRNVSEYLRSRYGSYPKEIQARLKEVGLNH